MLTVTPIFEAKPSTSQPTTTSPPPVPSNSDSDSIPIYRPPLTNDNEDVIPQVSRGGKQTTSSDLDPNEWSPNTISPQANNNGSYNDDTSGSSDVPTPKPTSIHPHCAKDEVEISVEDVVGIYCVKSTNPCSSDREVGDCPGPQHGLEGGSYCARVTSGVFGCRAHVLPSNTTTGNYTSSQPSHHL